MATMTTSDGLELTYYEWGVERRGDRPPVVLQHGFMANSHMNWELTGVVAALVADGRYVVALDARGHGASATPHDATFYGEQKMADDLSLLYDHLDTPTIHQVGYSMGAIVSLIAATRDRRIAHLAVGGVGAGVVELGGVDTRVLPAKAIVDAMTADDPGSIADPAARSFRELADATGADRLALAAHASVVHAAPIPLADISAATLVLAGDQDPLAARPDVLAATIDGAELVIVKGDHLQAVIDPAFAGAIVEFLGHVDR